MSSSSSLSSSLSTADQRVLELTSNDARVHHDERDEPGSSGHCRHYVAVVAAAAIDDDDADNDDAIDCDRQWMEQQ
jgi:hypothetical protein